MHNLELITYQCKSRIEHLIAKQKKQELRYLPEENIWYELGIDQGDGLGTQTVLRVDTTEQLLEHVISNRSIQKQLIDIGLQHVFLDVWHLNNDGLPSPIVCEK